MVVSVVQRLEGCVSGVCRWMSAGRLKLDTDGTELVWTGSERSLASAGCGGLSLALGGGVVGPGGRVRLLGVTFAEDLSLDRHVSNICKSCFFLASPVETCSSLTGH